MLAATRERRGRHSHAELGNEVIWVLSNQTPACFCDPSNSNRQGSRRSHATSTAGTVLQSHDHMRNRNLRQSAGCAPTRSTPNSTSMPSSPRDGSVGSRSGYSRAKVAWSRPTTSAVNKYSCSRQGSHGNLRISRTRTWTGATVAGSTAKAKTSSPPGKNTARTPTLQESTTVGWDRNQDIA